MTVKYKCIQMREFFLYVVYKDIIYIYTLFHSIANMFSYYRYLRIINAGSWKRSAPQTVKKKEIMVLLLRLMFKFKVCIYIFFCHRNKAKMSPKIIIRLERKSFLQAFNRKTFRILCIVTLWTMALWYF